MAYFKSFLLAAAAVAALGACSSKNPDTLVGMNLDENGAMMDANAAVDANLASTNSATSDGGNASTEPRANETSEVSANAIAAKGPKPSRSAVNAASNSAVNSTQLNDSDNQLPDEPDVPNVTTND